MSVLVLFGACLDQTIIVVVALTLMYTYLSFALSHSWICIIYRLGITNSFASRSSVIQHEQSSWWLDNLAQSQPPSAAIAT